MGSSSEVEYLLILSCDLGYLNNDKFNGILLQTIEIKKMLAILIKKLKADS